MSHSNQVTILFKVLDGDKSIKQRLCLWHRQKKPFSDESEAVSKLPPTYSTHSSHLGRNLWQFGQKALPGIRERGHAPCLCPANPPARDMCSPTSPALGLFQVLFSAVLSIILVLFCPGPGTP
jgi:hypothetical protein